MDRRSRLSTPRMEDRSHGLSSSTFAASLARYASIAGNPLFLIPPTVLATTRSWRLALIVALTTTIPLVAIILRNVRRGTWSDFDVSRRDQRLGLYLAGLPLLLAAGVILYAIDASPRMMRSVAAAFLLFAVGVIGHRFLKISMHMMFTTFCAVLIVWQHPWTAYAAVPGVALLAWSRHFLERHTWPEIAIGTLAGTMAGVFAVL
jgi:hypothetical protein